MPKTVLLLFHADPASIQTVPALAERIRNTPASTLEVYVFGPAERMLADPDQTEFNARSTSSCRSLQEVPGSV